MAKFKVFWFSKAGKRLFKTIIWLIIWFFTIIWIVMTSIAYIQIKNDASWLYAYNYMNMLNNIANNNWYEINNWLGKKKFSILWIDFYEIEKWKNRFELLLQIPNLKENTIKIDENFTWYEWDLTWTKFIQIPFNSKYFSNFWEEIYSDEYNDYGNQKRIWNKISEIKIELTNTRNVVWDFTLNNSDYKYFWDKNVWYEMLWDFRRGNIRTEDFLPWETRCIILTPINPITHTEKSLHDENCEFRHLEQSLWYLWYNELRISFNAIKFQDSEDLPHVKITAITIDEPYYGTN